MDPHLSLSLAAGLRHGWDFAHVPSGLGLGFFSVPSFFFIEVAGAGSRGHLYICFFYLFAVLYVWGSCKLRDSRDSSSPHERGSGIAPRPAHRVSLGDADGSVARCTLLLAIVAVLRYLPRGDAVASGDAAWKGMEGEGGGVMSHGRVTTSWLAGSVR